MKKGIKWGLILGAATFVPILIFYFHQPIFKLLSIFDAGDWFMIVVICIGLLILWLGIAEQDVEVSFAGVAITGLFTLFLVLSPKTGNIRTECVKEEDMPSIEIKEINGVKYKERLPTTCVEYKRQVYIGGWKDIAGE